MSPRARVALSVGASAIPTTPTSRPFFSPSLYAYGSTKTAGKPAPAVHHIAKTETSHTYVCPVTRRHFRSLSHWVPGRRSRNGGRSSGCPRF